MNQATRRVAFADPHYVYPSTWADGTIGDAVTEGYRSSYLIANAGQSSGDLRWYDYDPAVIQTGRDRNRAILSDLTPPFRTSAWSRHPSHDCLIACGITNGRINLHDLTISSQQPEANPPSSSQPLSSYSFPPPQHSHSGLPIGTTITSSSASTIGGLARDQTRTCTCLAWFWPTKPRYSESEEAAASADHSDVILNGSKGNPSYLAAGYDKARSDPSLLIWDAERLLSATSSPTGNGSNPREKRQRRLSASAFEVDRLTSNLPPAKEKELDKSGTIKRGRANEGPGQTNHGAGNKDLTSLNTRPLQQYLSGEIVNSLDTFPHTIYQLLASYGSKNVRLIDLRVPVPTAPTPAATGGADGAKTPTGRPATSTSGGAGVGTSTDPNKSISWRAATKAVYNLAVCPERPWMFASSEEGLAGIVRIWDLRFMPSTSSSNAGGGQVSSGSGGGVAGYSVGGGGGAIANVGEVLTIEAGRNGVASLKWDAGDYLAGRIPISRSRSGETWGGASRLGVGTSGGGVLVYDVISGGRVNGDGFAGNGRDSHAWSALTKVKGTEVRGNGSASGPLQSFAFLPSSRATNQSIVSIHRDGNIGLSHVRASVPITSGQQGDAVLAPSTLPAIVRSEATVSSQKTANTDVDASKRGRVQMPPKAQAVLGLGPKADLEEPVYEAWSDALAEEVGLKMKAKAEAGFGMNLLANDAIEDQFPTADGFLWEWLDRFVKLLGKSAMTGIDDYDFALQGICGIWEAAPLKAKNQAFASRSDTLLLPRNYESGDVADWASSRTPMNRSPASGNRKSLKPEDAHYAKSIGRIIEQRRAQFQDTTTLANSSRPNHRQLMLAICGELSGTRLGQELERIAETHLTKAACLMHLNRGLSKAVAMLQSSPDESHRLVAMLLQSSSLDPTAVARMQLQDGYLRAMIKYKAKDSSWDDIIKDPELPLLERLVLALKFVNDEKLTAFLKSMADTCVENGSLHGIVLVGLVGRGPELIAQYVDRTGDIQSAAILSAYMHRKTARSKRWIEQYRDLLDSWKLYAPRIAFDMAHGQIAKANGVPLVIPPQILLRCNWCQRVVTNQARSQALHAKFRASCCQSCGNRLPRCCICLLYIDAPVGDAQTPLTAVESATMFCQTCSHGGHYEHIARWFYGSDEDDEEAHDTCAVSGCNCRCSSL